MPSAAPAIPLVEGDDSAHLFFIPGTRKRAAKGRQRNTVRMTGAKQLRRPGPRLFRRSHAGF